MHADARNVVTGSGSGQDGSRDAIFGGAGGRANEGRLQLDGLSIGSAFGGAGVSAYIPDVGNAQEMTRSSRRAASAKPKSAARR